MKNVHIAYVLLGLLAVGVITVLFVWDFTEEEKEVKELTEEVSSVQSNDDLTAVDVKAVEPKVEIVGKSMLDLDLNMMISFPDDWQVGNSKEFGHSKYYFYARSNIGELEKGYNLNTRVEISQCDDNYQQMASNLEQKYADAKAISNEVPGWSEANWWRQTEEIKGQFDWPVEMVKLQNDAPIEGLPYDQYTYFMQAGLTNCTVVELTVPKAQAILDEAEITHVDQTDLEQQGFYVVNNVEFR